MNCYLSFVAQTDLGKRVNALKNGTTNAKDTTMERKKTMFLTRPKNRSFKRAAIQMKEMNRWVMNYDTHTLFFFFSIFFLTETIEMREYLVRPNKHLRNIYICFTF